MTEDSPGRRSRAEAGEQTRASLLAAGAELLREQPVGRILEQVTAPEVARRAGRTIGAFYHHWNDQESYRHDLLTWVLSPEILPTEETVTDLSAALTVAEPVDEIVRRNARANMVAGLDRPELALTLALSALARRDEGTRQLLNHQYTVLNESLEPVYAALFAAYGWVPRPPFTVHTFSTVLTALVEGLVIRHVADPGAVPMALPDEKGIPLAPDDESAWDLFSAVALALLPMMTMPADAAARDGRDASGLLGTDRDVRDLVRGIWAAWSDGADGARAPGDLSPAG
jgi:AcrR family transcriptional regulator